MHIYFNAVQKFCPILPAQETDLDNFSKVCSFLKLLYCFSSLGFSDNHLLYSLAIN